MNEPSLLILHVTRDKHNLRQAICIQRVDLIRPIPHRYCIPLIRVKSAIYQPYALLDGRWGGKEPKYTNVHLPLQEVRVLGVQR